MQKEAVYGLTEYYRDEIKDARLVAGTGCNAMTGLMPILPLLAAGVIETEDIIIDLATGVSGAGRSAKEGMLHSEVSEGYRAYSVAAHRHLAEFDQEMSLIAGKSVQVTFTPHLLPQNRGILATVYVKGDVNAIYAALKAKYEKEQAEDEKEGKHDEDNDDEKEEAAVKKKVMDDVEKMVVDDVEKVEDDSSSVLDQADGQDDGQDDVPLRQKT